MRARYTSGRFRFGWPSFAVLAICALVGLCWPTITGFYIGLALASTCCVYTGLYLWTDGGTRSVGRR